MIKRKVAIKVVKVKLHKDVKEFSVWQLLTFVLVFASIGGYLIYHSFAYTAPEPTATIIGDDNIFAYGASPTLTYSATNAISCVINGAPVSVADGDNFYTAPAATTSTTYTLSCSGPGGTVTASTRLAVAPLAAATAATTPTYKVNFVRFCASDVCKSTPDLETVKNSVRNWYTRRVGKSFSVGDMNLKTIRGNHTAYWYAHTGSYPLKIQNVLENVSNFLNNNGKVPAGNIDTVVLGFPVNDHCGSGFTGWRTKPINRVSNPDNGENVSVTDPFKCSGPSFNTDVAHELGHNFGLWHDNMAKALAVCSEGSPHPPRNDMLMDCHWACSGSTLTSCKLNGRQHGLSIPDWKLLADYSPFFQDTSAQPTLKLVKQVDNHIGGTKTPHDWTLTASGNDGFNDFGDSTTFHKVDAGVTYSLSESSIAGYAESGAPSCDGGKQSGNSITLGGGQNVTCTFFNYGLPPLFSVVKRVVGGTKHANDFSVKVNNVQLTGGILSTDNLSDTYIYSNPKANTSYTVSEDQLTGYTQTSLICVDVKTGHIVNNPVILSLDQNVTCTITNTGQ